MCRKLKEYDIFLRLLCSSVGGHSIAQKKILDAAEFHISRLTGCRVWHSCLFFWWGLQIAAAAKIQTDLYWQNNSSNSSGNLTTNTFSPLLSCGVQNTAKISWYAIQLWALCCTHSLGVPHETETNRYI